MWQFDFDLLLKPRPYETPPRPPPLPPPELQHLHAICRRRLKGVKAHGAYIDGVGLTEDVQLCLGGGGGRFEAPPERCALVDRRMSRLVEMVRDEMGAAWEAHLLYQGRLAALCTAHPHMRQFVDKRVEMLSVFTEKELKQWFESGGYNSPKLDKTDERKAALNRQHERLCKLKYMLKTWQHELDLTIAQRCRGWTSDT